MEATPIFVRYSHTFWGWSPLLRLDKSGQIGANPLIYGAPAVLDLLAAPGFLLEFGEDRLFCPVSAASCKATTALTRFYDLDFGPESGSNPGIQGPVAGLDLLAAF